jgi:hypothetical protein
VDSIQNLIEPTNLLLSWRPKTVNELYLVAKIEREKENYSFTYLTETTEFEAAIKQGFCGYPAFSLRTRLHTNNVLDAFLRRLPPKTRGDYNLYLQQHGLPAPFPYSDFALLGYTGAKSPADGFVLSIG